MRCFADRRTAASCFGTWTEGVPILSASRWSVEGDRPYRPRCGQHERAGGSGEGAERLTRALGGSRRGRAEQSHGPADGGQKGCRDRRRAVLARGVQRGAALPFGPSDRRQGVQGEWRTMTLPRASRGVSSPLWSRGRRGVRGGAPANDASGTDAPLGRRSATCLVSRGLALFCAIRFRVLTQRNLSPLRPRGASLCRSTTHT
jgi:hypothetical protein